MWSRGTRACGRCSRTGSGCRGSRSCRRRGAAAAGDRLGRRSGLAAALTAAAGRGFDLSRELPLRAHLFELVMTGSGMTDMPAITSAEHVLLIVLHHIAGDGWSLGPLARDLCGVLPGAAAGRGGGTGAAAGAVRRLHAVAAGGARRRGRRRSALARQLSFWTEALQDLPDQIELPADRPRPAVSSHRGGHVALSIGADLHRGVVASRARTARACSWCCRRASPDC